MSIETCTKLRSNKPLKAERMSALGGKRTFAAGSTGCLHTIRLVVYRHSRIEVSALLVTTSSKVKVRA